ncbi:hypothetical protein KBB96_10105 [Luteolibacter ambystomatis]|uniref:Uncharacterized protein n=1 Tax=Luteolibacter ambystomatis TaxID=2824561 RepID=A0A975PHD9_9BACT|nr:hypothetical protein [Luteolibacter ambystomatis]QUE53232.1 hypothetical protein KBB96_10105 [Luteolibacter ambystomatis]
MGPLLHAGCLSSHQRRAADGMRAANRILNPKDKTMSPIDPAKEVPEKQPTGMAPPYVDEDPNEALVEEGLDVAEDEAREAAADDFEANARLSDEEDLAGEEDFEDEKPSSLPPEVAALHEEGDPEEEASAD